MPTMLGKHFTIQHFELFSPKKTELSFNPGPAEPVYAQSFETV